MIPGRIQVPLFQNLCFLSQRLQILATAMFLGACKYKGVRFYLTLLFELKNGIFQHISGKIQVPLCQNLCFLSTCILPEIAILAFKMSSQVKSDPVNLTGLKRQSWSQNLRSQSQKTKKRGNNAFTRRFGKYYKENIIKIYYVIWSNMY